MTKNMLKVLLICIGLNFATMGGAHVYLSENPDKVLLVVDTSNTIKPVKNDIIEWIRSYSNSARYKELHIATDKAYLGTLEGLPGVETVFRVTFGKLNVQSVTNKYAMDTNYQSKLLLTNQDTNIEGVSTISF